jgi:hypothetical protein
MGDEKTPSVTSNYMEGIAPIPNKIKSPVYRLK